MTVARRTCLWVLCLFVFRASPGFAQASSEAPSGPPPAHLSLIEGQAFIDRDGRSDAAVANVPLLDGDRLRTEEGRLEVILPDGSLLHVDRFTKIDVMAADLLRLLQGRAYVVVRRGSDPSTAARYQVDTPIASVQTGGPGEFRVVSGETGGGQEVELAVFRGEATLANDLGAQDVRAGERSVVREGLAPSEPQYFNSARWDAFDRWSAARRDEKLGTASVQYLPAELTVYASTFDRYGTWRDDAQEGAVWYPSVESDWRPYSVGYWRSYPAWDSFWVGGDPWGWPTHHYGYWGFSFSFGWYWRPTPVWGPSWVYWAYSPGYVSWCPLGRYGYPVFGQFGVHGGHYAGHIDPWRGWTVMPRQHFGMPVPVHRVAVDGHHLDPAARGAFAAQRYGPNAGHAVPRAYAGGGTAVPRGGGPNGAPRGGRGGAAVAPRGAGGAGVSAANQRPSPAEAARIFAGGRPASASSAARRPFPGAASLGSMGHRTEAPAATPDVMAFRSRRDSLLTPRNGAGSGAPTAFESGGRARAYPRANPSPAGRSNSAPDLARQFEAWSGSTRPASPSAPRQDSWSSRAPVRRSPYAGETSGAPGAQRREAMPRAYDRPSQAAPRRDLPSWRGGSPSPQTAPLQNMPSWRSASPPPQSSPSARPRDGGGGFRSGPAVRSGGGPQSSSAPSAAPRYNSGSAASHQRGGGGSPPSGHRRGGGPD